MKAVHYIIMSAVGEYAQALRIGGEAVIDWCDSFGERTCWTRLAEARSWLKSCDEDDGAYVAEVIVRSVGQYMITRDGGQLASFVEDTFAVEWVKSTALASRFATRVSAERCIDLAGDGATVVAEKGGEA